MKVAIRLRRTLIAHFSISIFVRLKMRVYSLGLERYIKNVLEVEGNCSIRGKKTGRSTHVGEI